MTTPAKQLCTARRSPIPTHVFEQGSKLCIRTRFVTEYQALNNPIASMFRAQQNAFDAVVGKHVMLRELPGLQPGALVLCIADLSIYSEGDGRESNFRELGVYHGCLRQSR